MSHKGASTPLCAFFFCERNSIPTTHITPPTPTTLPSTSEYLLSCWSLRRMGRWRCWWRPGTSPWLSLWFQLEASPTQTKGKLILKVQVNQRKLIVIVQTKLILKVEGKQTKLILKVHVEQTKLIQKVHVEQSKLILKVQVKQIKLILKVKVKTNQVYPNCTSQTKQAYRKCQNQTDQAYFTLRSKSNKPSLSQGYN